MTRTKKLGIAAAITLILTGCAANSEIAKTTEQAYQTLQSVPVETNVEINGKKVTFHAYEIDGGIYYRLDRVAEEFSGTSKSMYIENDKENNTVRITTNKLFDPMADKETEETEIQTLEAVDSTSRVECDSKEVSAAGYVIGGSLYLTMEELQDMLGFTVTTDEETDLLKIETGVPWTPVNSIDFSPREDVMIQNDDGTLTSMATPFYQSTEVADGTWQILSDGDYMYLVEGDDEAILIDTGYGAGNIREYCQTLTKKPLNYVINTHYHFDHTANNAYFEKAYMSADSVEYATIPYPSFEGINFPRDYPIETVGDGYVFDLGSRTLEVIEIPNHTVGGIALLDRKERILFSGDEIMRADNLSLNCSVEQFAKNMEKLEVHRSEFDRCMGGPGIVEASAVDNFLTIANYILSGEGTPEPAASGAGSGQKQGQEPTVEAESGQTVYARKRVRPDDRSEPGDTTKMVRMVYSGCSLTYDSQRVWEQ